jgi:hypothetical protein
MDATCLLALSSSSVEERKRRLSFHFRRRTCEFEAGLLRHSTAHRRRCAHAPLRQRRERLRPIALPFHPFPTRFCNPRFGLLSPLFLRFLRFARKTALPALRTAHRYPPRLLSTPLQLPNALPLHFSRPPLSFDALSRRLHCRWKAHCLWSLRRESQVVHCSSGALPAVFLTSTFPPLPLTLPRSRLSWAALRQRRLSLSFRKASKSIRSISGALLPSLLDAKRVDRFAVIVPALASRQVLYSDPSAAYLARHVGHLAGLPVDVPALTTNRCGFSFSFPSSPPFRRTLTILLPAVDRLCGSGFQTIINAAQEIKLGEADVVLTGGTENMSLSPCSSSPFRPSFARHCFLTRKSVQTPCPALLASGTSTAST